MHKFSKIELVTNHLTKTLEDYLKLKMSCDGVYTHTTKKEDENYKIEVINDYCYTSNSKDNTFTYKSEYGDKGGIEESAGSHRYGLRLYIDEVEYSSAILFGKGWANSFSDKLISINYVIFTITFYCF